MPSRSLDAFGLVVAIQAEAAEIFPALARELPPLGDAPVTASPDVVYRVARVGSDQLVLVRGRRTLGFSSALSSIVSLLVHDLQATLARTAPGWTFVHAGVVAIEGRALLLPGRSGAGKSTLVAALVREGAQYGSDEFAVIDGRGLVHPYRRWLALRSPDYAFTRVPPEQLRPDAAPEPMPVGMIVFTEFEEGAAMKLRQLPPSGVALRLLPHCPGVRGRPRETLRTLRELSCAARGFEGVRGDAHAAAHSLLDRVRDLGASTT